MFEIGDRVVVMDGSNLSDYTCDWIPYMNKFIGKNFTICSIINFAKGRVGYCFEELQDTDDSDYIFDSRCVTEVCELTQAAVFDYLIHATDLPVWKDDCPAPFQATTIDGSSTVQGFILEVYGLPMMATTTGKFVKVIPSSIALYSGYVDKYGEPIYEGNIVSVTSDLDRCRSDPDRYTARVVYIRNQTFNGFALRSVTDPNKIVSANWHDLVIWDTARHYDDSSFYYPYCE